VTLRQSFQFKPFASKRIKHIHRTIDVSSEIWNHSVAIKNRYYKLFGQGLPKAKLQAHLAKLRNGRKSHWQSVGSQSVQAITDRLYLAWEAFFKGDIKRPPTFCKRRKYRSFTLKQAGYKLLGHGRMKIAAPQPLKAELRHIRKAQRVLSRKQKGSKSHKRASRDVARAHKKVANFRNDWQWKQSRLLVVMFDMPAFETLNIKAMHQLWGRKVGDLGFADFLLKARWMLKKLGKDLIKIGRWEPTTKTCHLCGHAQDMRTFVCGGCGNVECRDVNAARNILEAGRRLWSGADSKTSQEAIGATTVESHALSRESASKTTPGNI
jgi:putative transposase